MLSASDFRQPVLVEVPSDAKPVKFNRSYKGKMQNTACLTEPQLSYSVSSSESATTRARSSSEPEKAVSGCLETGVGLCLSVFFVIGGGVS